MCCSFVFLAYGLYLDRLVQCEMERRAARRGYHRISDREQQQEEEEAANVSQKGVNSLSQSYQSSL